jgi:hypothetical protein
MSDARHFACNTRTSTNSTTVNNAPPANTAPGLDSVSFSGFTINSSSSPPAHAHAANIKTPTAACARSRLCHQ